LYASCSLDEANIEIAESSQAASIPSHFNKFEETETFNYDDNGDINNT
jgi:hypothetical protein